jgi:raffinose/stachyose/melibiose transport system permease protein
MKILNDKAKDILSNYLFVLPAIFMFCVFSLYPFYEILRLSVFQWDGVSPVMNFVGLSHFKDIIFSNKIWWSSVWHAAFITILALIVQNALALALAVACDRDIKGGKFYRVVFYLPPILSGIVVGLIWNWIFEGNFGLLNHWLTAMGLGHATRAWLAEPQTALTCVAVIHMWKGFGWGFIIMLAGLQGIPRELYEAAKVDGATPWQMFWNVTVPLMIPVFILVSILTILGTMQIYDIIVATTGGGPGYHTEVPITRILTNMTGYGRFGYACAMGLVFGVLLLVVSLGQLRLSRYMKRT